MIFENVKVRGVHASRFIMSWIRSGGELLKLGVGYHAFEKWLDSLELDTDEKGIILDLAKNGKLELELSAEKFLKQNKIKDEKEYFKFEDQGRP